MGGQGEGERERQSKKRSSSSSWSIDCRGQSRETKSIFLCCTPLLCEWTSTELSNCRLVWVSAAMLDKRNDASQCGRYKTRSDVMPNFYFTLYAQEFLHVFKLNANLFFLRYEFNACQPSMLFYLIPDPLMTRSNQITMSTSSFL